MNDIVKYLLKKGANIIQNKIIMIRVIIIWMI